MLKSSPFPLTDLAAEKGYTQTYEKRTTIDGVKIIELKHMVGDEGDFGEVIRLDDKGELELFPGFKLAQINRTRLTHGAIKAWHMHYYQDEIWFVLPSFQMLVGLYDARKDSPTAGATMRFNLGGGYSKLLYIPRGVGHGCCNVSYQEAEMIYFASNKFNLNDPDERRIPFDAVDPNFWNPERD